MATEGTEKVIKDLLTKGSKKTKVFLLPFCILYQIPKLSVNADTTSRISIECIQLPL